MQKSTLPQGIKTLRNWRDKGILTFDHPIQRSTGQWSLLQKSLLVHSMIAGYPIPNCYFLKTKNDNGDTVYSCLDSKQRLTSVFEFIEEDGFALHSATPTVRYDGFEYDLADTKFVDLPEELKDEILGYRLSIFCLEDCSDEEVEEIFARLNNSTPLSAIQKTRSVIGSDMARWCKDICNSEFYQHSVNMTLAQIRREADLETLLQAMLLLDSRHEGYDEWKAISTAEVTKYCSHIRGCYNEDKRLTMEEIIAYLSKAFPHQHKFLKKSNVPTVIVLAKLALENEIEAEEFKRFIDAFSNSVCPAFEECTGSGNVKRFKTEGRLVAMATAMEEYFKLEDLRVLSISGVDHEEATEVVSEIEVDEEAVEEVVATVEESDEAEMEGAEIIENPELLDEGVSSDVFVEPATEISLEEVESDGE